MIHERILNTCQRLYRPNFPITGNQINWCLHFCPSRCQQSPVYDSTPLKSRRWHRARFPAGLWKQSREMKKCDCAISPPRLFTQSFTTLEVHCIPSLPTHPRLWSDKSCARKGRCNTYRKEASVTNFYFRSCFFFLSFFFLRGGGPIKLGLRPILS